MTSRTVRAEPRIETMTPERIKAMEAAIATVQAQGAVVTAAAVHRLVSGHRRTVQVYVKAWKEDQQQREASPVAPASPPTPPVPRLLSLPGRIAQRAQALEATRRDVSQLEQEQAQDIADLRNGILEAQRLVPLFRRAYQQSMLPLYAGDQGIQREVERLRPALVALVGEAEVDQVLADSQYRPSWLEG